MKLLAFLVLFPWATCLVLAVALYRAIKVNAHMMALVRRLRGKKED